MTRVAIAVVLLTLVACSDSVVAPLGPNNGVDTNTTPTSGSTVVNANWIGDATVVSVSNSGGCGWGRTVGETRSGVLWNVTITGTTVTVDEDMANFPTDDVLFSGVISGVDFTAQHMQQPAGVCLFAGGTLTGTFSNDFSTFTADETLRWGVENQTIVKRRWEVRKR